MTFLHIDFPFPFPELICLVVSIYRSTGTVYRQKAAIIFLRFCVTCGLKTDSARAGQADDRVEEEEEEAAFGKRLEDGFRWLECWERGLRGCGGGYCSWRLTEFLHRITKKSENDEIWSEMRRLTNDWWDRTCVVLTTHLSELSIHFEWSIAFSTQNWTTQLRSTRFRPIALFVYYFLEIDTFYILSFFWGTYLLI